MKIIWTDFPRWRGFAINIQQIDRFFVPLVSENAKDNIS